MTNEKNVKKKKLKGMTLAEVIISLAILSVMTVVLVGTSGLIDKYIKSANNVNKTTAAQAPIAESKNNSKAHTVPILDEDGNPVLNDEGNPTFTEARIEFSYPTSGDDANKIATVKGFLYEADDPSAIDLDAVGGALNMKFIDNLEYDSSRTVDEETDESEESE